MTSGVPDLRFCMLLAFLLQTKLFASAEQPVDFNRDVRPILSNKCFRCHGPDAGSRMAELRLDIRDAAIGVEGRAAAIVPGKPDQSELIRRVCSPDADSVMPPPETSQTLTPAEIETLRNWIVSGAEYQTHWSLIPPQAISPPAVINAPWPRNEIDYFILSRLEHAGLEPAPEASADTLLRRLALDLTGLPPDLQQLDQFLNDSNDDAYERVVDRLLASAHFGERMAVDWLDTARYADTNGYFGDNTRSIWPWRDWVIAAFNQNMPFDQFTVTQLAGDLLPEPTTSDLIATGFNRNHIANNETGIIDEEFRVEYVADRLETTATTWMALTVGCARCHDHKYDPLSQREYYQLFAFFNNGPEKGLITEDSPAPKISLPSLEQQQQTQVLAEEQAIAERVWSETMLDLQLQINSWEQSAETDGHLPSAPLEGMVTCVDFNDGISGIPIGTTVELLPGILGNAAQFDATQHIQVDDCQLDLDAAWSLSIWSKSSNSLGCLLSKIEPTGNRRGLEILWQKGRFQINLVHRWGVDAISIITSDPLPTNLWHHLVVAYDGTATAAGLKVYVDGRRATVETQQDTLSGSLMNPEPLKIARRDTGLGYYGLLDELRILQRKVTAEEIEDWFWSERLRGIIAIPAQQRRTADVELLVDYFVRQHADQTTRDARRRMVDIRLAEAELRKSIPTTMVMQELPEPRATHLLERGEYNRPGIAVQSDVPNALTPWPVQRPRNRLGLARWLVSPDHPLTARVAVNRLWQQCFGEGLVRTMNDFGSQGEMPSHPELLDWLAIRFVNSGWDVKAMLKLIVTSAAYRQSSVANAGLSESDPQNRLLARASRWRLSAEMVRDQALAVSGLLVPTIGGPSVRPYQPPGLWEEVSYNGDETYAADTDDGLWRRSLYTFIKRQSPPPGLVTFDGPTREKCTVQRARTNTPLQALILLNDITYVEAARCLAATAMSMPQDIDNRLRWVFRRVTSRWPDTTEQEALKSLWLRQQERFGGAPEAARQLISIGHSAADAELAVEELAAWTVVAHTLLNLDEVITRQ